MNNDYEKMLTESYGGVEKKRVLNEIIKDINISTHLNEETDEQYMINNQISDYKRYKDDVKNYLKKSDDGLDHHRLVSYLTSNTSNRREFFAQCIFYGSPYYYKKNSKKLYYPTNVNEYKSEISFLLGILKKIMLKLIDLRCKKIYYDQSSPSYIRCILNVFKAWENKIGEGISDVKFRFNKIFKKPEDKKVLNSILLKMDKDLEQIKILKKEYIEKYKKSQKVKNEGSLYKLDKDECKERLEEYKKWKDNVKKLSSSKNISFAYIKREMKNASEKLYFLSECFSKSEYVDEFSFISNLLFKFTFELLEVRCEKMFKNKDIRVKNFTYVKCIRNVFKTLEGRIENMHHDFQYSKFYRDKETREKIGRMVRDKKDKIKILQKQTETKYQKRSETEEKSKPQSNVSIFTSNDINTIKNDIKNITNHGKLNSYFQQIIDKYIKNADPLVRWKLSGTIDSIIHLLYKGHIHIYHIGYYKCTDKYDVNPAERKKYEEAQRMEKKCLIKPKKDLKNGLRKFLNILIKEIKSLETPSKDVIDKEKENMPNFSYKKGKYVFSYMVDKYHRFISSYIEDEYRE